MSLTMKEIRAWKPEELSQRLAGPPEAVAKILSVMAGAGIAEAQALYAQALLDGRGVARDPVEALRLFIEAAQAGHVMAMNMVGRCCEQGWGTPADKTLAAQWYKAAADRGLDWAMYNLATLHCLGEGVPLDRKEALRLYRKAMNLGHVKSINMVGGFYEDGWVVERDLGQAADHYRCAAEGGDFRGQFNHARMLILVGKTVEAQDWLRRIPETATPAFLEKARGWLADHAPGLLGAIEQPPASA